MRIKFGKMAAKVSAFVFVLLFSGKPVPVS